MGILLVLLLLCPLAAQPAPNGYIAHRAARPLRIDGKIDGEWKHAPWTTQFVDIEGDAKPRPRFRTRAKMMWDDRYFYIAAELEEPHVWGTLTKHDSVIFHDNDFEVFIDPNADSHEYFEFEMNALNTTWDLFLPKPYKDQGKADNSWEMPGLKTAVAVRGTLNNPQDVDKAWTLEIAMPWTAFGAAAHRPLPPHAGDVWRVNFSRVEWQHEVVDGKYRRVPGTKEDNWVWSPQGKVNMHLPEHWGYVQFSARTHGAETFAGDPERPVRMRLQRYYRAQFEFFQQRGRWATAAELPPDEGLTLSPAEAGWRACEGKLCIRADAKIERD